MKTSYHSEILTDSMNVSRKKKNPRSILSQFRNHKANVLSPDCTQTYNTKKQLVISPAHVQPRRLSNRIQDYFYSHPKDIHKQTKNLFLPF
jgi:hypothetical protein